MVDKTETALFDQSFLVEGVILNPLCHDQTGQQFGFLIFVVENELQKDRQTAHLHEKVESIQGIEDILQLFEQVDTWWLLFLDFL